MTDNTPVDSSTRQDRSTQASWAKVSVLIPAYNHAPYVRTCLDSIRAAASCLVEILVLDDGSDDRTYEEVEQWMSENNSVFTRCFLERRNRNGVSKNLNYLCSIATGEYILWIASDDILQPEGISSRLNLFQEWKADAIIGDATIIDQNGEVMFKSAFHDYQKMNITALKMRSGITPVLIKHWFVPGPSLMFKKSLLNDIGTLNEELVVEDRDFFLRMLAGGHVAYLDLPVAGYRIHRSNTSQDPQRAPAVRRDVFWSNWHNATLFSGISQIYLMTYLHDWWMMRLFSKHLRIAYFASAPSIIVRKLLGVFF